MNREISGESALTHVLLGNAWWTYLSGAALAAVGALVLANLPPGIGYVFTSIGSAMSIMLAAAAVLMLGLAGIAFLGLSTDHDAREQVVYRRSGKGLVNEGEHWFMAALEEAAGPRVRVFARVCAQDVLQPSAPARSRAWYTAFDRLAPKHFDFVLCDAGSLEVIAAVQLDDRHKVRDGVLEAACAGAGLPLIRFRKRASYDIARIRQELSVCADMPAQPEELPAKRCPNCDRALVCETATRGALRGRRVWRCSGAPACRTVIPAL
jgi:hypothetical protein